MGWYCPRCGHASGTAGTCPRDGAALEKVSSHDLHGRKLGEYTVLATLGSGSYGAVFRAVHERSGMLVAIKLLHRPIDDVESKRVITEARAAAMLNHPNIVQVYDLAVTSDRRPYIVMQLLDGKPLSALLNQRLEVGTAVSIANDVLDALGAAHQRGVIHRDLKPDNIFVTKGRALIVDFGLAKLVADPRSPSLTATGEALGTPSYMAPEQIRGELADGRADLYAVGCVLFEMLAGRPPFEGAATYMIFDAHLHRAAPSVAELRSDVPPVLDAAIARALSKEPGGRFATAAEMQRALAGRITKRPRWPRVVAALALAAVSAGIVLAVVDDPRPHGDDPPEPVTKPAPGPRQLEIPPARPDEPPLDPRWEEAIRSTTTMLSSYPYSRADVVRMRCGIPDPIPMQWPATSRAYSRRIVALLEAAQPDLDYAKDCAKPPPVPKRIPMPEPIEDELPVQPGIEAGLAALHDQLDAKHLDAAMAQRMHCDFSRQRAETIRSAGSLDRHTRGFHRRADLLLEAYHPGSTKARCR